MIPQETELYITENGYTSYPNIPSLRSYLRFLIARGFTPEDILKELSALDGRNFVKEWNRENE